MKSITKGLPLFFVSVLCLLMAIPSHAQWNTNTSVNLQISGLPTADMQTVSTTDGKLWVAFYHLNGGNYDMRAQLFDANGNKLLGPDGVLVSNQTSGSAIYVFNVCTDQSNNLIIGSQYESSGTMKAMVYKISQSGTHLWNSNGIYLGDGLAPYPATISTGETVVAWIDGNSSTLSMQKITTGGTLAWGSPISITVSGSNTTRGQVIANLSGKYTVVYQKNAGGYSTNLYAQMFNSSGVAQYSPLQICNQGTAPWRYYSIQAEGDTTYYGYYSSTGNRFNSFLQRINPNGTIPWGVNGSAFNTSTGTTDNYQMTTSIKLTAGSPYVWSVCDFSDFNQTIYGVYIQKFLKTTGARQFGDQAKIVYAINSDKHTAAGELQLVDDKPMFMHYDKDYKIYVTKLDASGNFVWPYNKTEISSTIAGGSTPKGRYGFNMVGNDRLAGTWTETRTGTELAYIQGISKGGLFGLDVATQGNVPATITVPAGTLQLLATVYPSYANQAVNWSIIPGTGQATINSSGLVTALTDGTVWAKAEAQQDATVSDMIEITISNQVPIPPTVVTLPATGVGLTGATLNGSVNANYFASDVTFDWGLTTSYTNTATASPAQVTGNVAVPVLAQLSGLTPGTTYHFRCSANNTGGLVHGVDLTFTTLCQMAGTMGSVTGPDDVCAGVSGQVYSVPAFPGATGYIWTIPPGTTIVSGNNTNTITVNYGVNALSGVVSVYATDGTCFSLPSPDLPVSVTSLPDAAGPVSGNQVVCDGEQGVEYSVDPIASATGYTWTVPAGATIASGSNTNAIIVNFSMGSSAGSITVQGSNYCGTGAVSPPLSIEITPTPAAAGTITGPDAVCIPAAGVIYAVPAITNAFSYIWTVPAGCTIVSGANTNQITVNFSAAAVAGNITVYGANGNCHGQPSAPLAVSLHPVPATPVITQVGEKLVSSADNGNQWYLNGTLIPGATGKEYIPLENGIYTVVVTVDGCSSAISNSITVVSVALKNDLPAFSLEAYPNPNNGSFTLLAGALPAGEYCLDLINSRGSSLWKESLVLAGGSMAHHLRLENLPAGVYTVILSGDGVRVTRKISINR